MPCNTSKHGGHMLNFIVILTTVEGVWAKKVLTVLRQQTKW